MNSRSEQFPLIGLNAHYSKKSVKQLRPPKYQRQDDTSNPILKVQIFRSLILTPGMSLNLFIMKGIMSPYRKQILQEPQQGFPKKPRQTNLIFFWKKLQTSYSGNPTGLAYPQEDTQCLSPYPRRQQPESTVYYYVGLAAGWSVLRDYWR